MLDTQGYRYNVGIIVTNKQGQLLWCRRSGTDNAWQFPQGGIQANESPQEAMYRELKEELGLDPKAVRVIAETGDWVRYDLPEKFQRPTQKPLCIGQKQKWFLLELVVDAEQIQLAYSPSPEFDCWQWVDYWYPLDHVIRFKRDAYRQVLTEFEDKVKR